ncbi:MAG: GNAT family N-acetyltransferase [Anaerolineales bacterium]|nr:GNAT family N-acetyltransferase [Anaerolineales bacterium]
MTIHIRDLTTYHEFTQVQSLHRTIWGLSEGLYPPMLNTAAHNGGVVLGAFDDDTMIGFSFAFLGRHPNGTLKLCSQTTGLLPTYRHQGLGERLKWEQFDRARKTGLQLITWTVDPLEAPNAILNFRKLGGLCHTYHVNLYGEHFSAFGEGMPADRLTVEWWLENPRVLRLRRGEATLPLTTSSPVANPARGNGFSRQITHLDLTLTTPTILLEIPVDIQALRRTNLPLARDWRLNTRQVLQTYFANSYQIRDAYSTWADTERRVFYVLKKEE